MNSDAILMESYFVLPDGTETMLDNVSDEDAVGITVIVYVGTKKIIFEVFRDGNLTLNTLNISRDNA